MVFLWWCSCVFVFLRLCFRGGVVVFLWWCGCVFVIVLVVVVSLWWCGCVFVVVFLWWQGCVFCGCVFDFLCDCVFGVVWLRFCFCGGAFVARSVGEESCIEVLATLVKDVWYKGSLV